MNSFRPLLATFVALSVAAALGAAESREAAALKVLKSSADLHEKARACQELADFGGPASVPALAALLHDEHLSDYARSGLEGIKDPSAGRALRDALKKLNGRQLAGVVNSLGVRREKPAVPELRALALDPNRGVAQEAVASLGLIANADAAKVLEHILANGPSNLKVPAAHAALAAAEQLAKEKNASAARNLLDAVIRAKPTAPITTVAQNQATTLRNKR